MGNLAVMAGERTVYLVRHGCTSLNAASKGPERERGWSDVSLDAAGRKEAVRSAAKLSKLGIKIIESSDLKRAKQTGEIISDYIGVPVEFNDGLRTWNTGYLAGRLKVNAEPVIANLVRRDPEEAPKGGESFYQFCRRIRSTLADIFKVHTENPMAIIVHHRVERLIKASGDEWGKIDLDEFLSDVGEHPGQIEKWQINPAVLSSGSHKYRKVSDSGAESASTMRAANATTRKSSYISVR